MMEYSLTILERDRDLISREIYDSGKFEDILYSLFNCNAFSLQVFQEFLTQTSSEISRVHRFIQRMSYDAGLIEPFIQALLKYALNDLAHHINPNVSPELNCNPSHEFAGQLTTLPHIRPSQSYPSISTMPHYLPPNGSLSFPDGFNDRPAEPLKIKVKKSGAIFGTDVNDKFVYKNSSSPRGHVFIANYNKFHNDDREERRGSQVDVKNLCDLYIQMGYKVIDPHIDLTRAETFKALREFRDNAELAFVDSCIVIIMSHGHNATSFCTADRHIMDLEVFELFNNHQCPNLKTKPKIFIFQYCRGPTPDLGVEHLMTPVSNEYAGEEELETDAAYKGMTIPLTNLTSFSDMFMIYATYPGYVSFRNPVTGSWLIEAICIEFMNNSWCKDIETLMKMVSQRVINFNSDKGRKQVIVTSSVGFNKHFYFNPMGSHEPDNFDLNQMGAALPMTNNPSMTCSLPLDANPAGTPHPHQLQPIHHELLSRCSTPDPFNDLSRSSSGSQLCMRCQSSSISRLRHTSGKSNSSEFGEAEIEEFVSRRRSDSNPLSPPSRPPVPPLYSPPSIFSPTANENNQTPSSTTKDEELTSSINKDEDIVDAPVSRQLDTLTTNSNIICGSAEDYKMFRLEKASKEDPNPLSSSPSSNFKRQLSIPSEREALRKAHDLQQYFYVNDLDEEASAVENLKVKIKKNKQKNKRRKQDVHEVSNSLEY